MAEFISQVSLYSWKIDFTSYCILLIPQQATLLPTVNAVDVTRKTKKTVWNSNNGKCLWQASNGLCTQLLQRIVEWPECCYTRLHFSYCFLHEPGFRRCFSAYSRREPSLGNWCRLFKGHMPFLSPSQWYRSTLKEAQTTVPNQWPDLTFHSLVNMRCTIYASCLSSWPVFC